MTAYVCYSFFYNVSLKCYRSYESYALVIVVLGNLTLNLHSMDGYYEG